MAKHYSKYFNVSHKDLVLRGVYNGFLDRDSLLHIDPLLLKGCKIHEFENAYDEFLKYFHQFVPLAKGVKQPTTNDRCFRRMKELFSLREIPNTGLGYSKSNNHGSGISGTLATQLANSAYDIITLGMDDPEIFCLLPLIEDNIGADRISDMTIAILQNRFLLYTQRVAKELNLPTKTYSNYRESFEVPFYKDKPLHFIPMCILSDLPTAHDFEDIDKVCNYNTALRKKVAEIIGLSWQDCKELKKSEWKSLILRNPNCYNTVINGFRELIGIPYDFTSDKKEQYLDILLEELVAKSPLHYIPQKDRDEKTEVHNLTMAICKQFKHLVEDNHLSDLIHRKGRKPDESDWQILLYTIADTYKTAAKLDIAITREDNPGVGEIDFHITRGSKANTIIEIKRSVNKDLLHGYRSQLAAYMKAEKADSGIFMVIMETENIQNIKEQIEKVQIDMKNNGEYIPDVIYINGMKQFSASNPHYTPHSF